MGDTNNNRTNSILQTTKKSEEHQFDITSLLGKQQHKSPMRFPQQNKEPQLKYPNFWPTPTIQQPMLNTQQSSFTLIPPANFSPISEKRNKANGRSMKTTLQDMSPEQLTNDGIEWVRIIKTPLSSTASNVSDDEFILRCLTAESTGSGSSSIRWAEDAVESEWTVKLQQQWDDIEQVCASINQPNKPSQMPQAIYNECLEWRRAFPHQDNPRFLWSKQSTSTAIESPRELIPLRSSTPLDDSQDYVHSWLTQCQQTSTEFVSLPIQSAKTKDVIRVLGEKGQFEEMPKPNPRSIENRSPPASLLEYRSRIKVQRPISSHVRGHTITPISTGLIGNRDRRRFSKESSLLAMIDEQQLSKSKLQRSPVENHNIWSRHEHIVIQEEPASESMKAEINNSKGRLTENSKSFINWLFFDDNIEHS